MGELLNRRGKIRERRGKRNLVDIHGLLVFIEPLVFFPYQLTERTLILAANPDLFLDELEIRAGVLFKPLDLFDEPRALDDRLCPDGNDAPFGVAGRSQTECPIAGLFNLITRLLENRTGR